MVRSAPTSAWLIDFEHPENNDWLAVNQFTVVENKNRRPDIVVFVNGIPLALFELKNLADENATLQGAWNQIQTYRKRHSRRSLPRTSSR